METEVKSEVKAPETPKEAPKEAPKEVKKEEIPVSTRIAAIAKREKEILKKEKEAKKIIEDAQKIAKNKDKYKQDAKLVLDELGMSFEDFTNLYLNSMDPNKKKSAEDMVKELEKKMEEKETLSKQEKEQKEKEYIEEQIRLFKTNIKKEVDASDYDLIKETKSYDTVFEVIEAYFNETGEYLDIKQAAESVEKELEEEVNRILKTKKFAKKEEPKEEKKEEKKKSLFKTLSNVSAPATPAESNSKLLSNEESLKRAASLLKFR